jgi:Leucine-rich repeat (LRR) protein
LKGASITDRGAQLIASILKRNDSITRVDLARNRITHTGCIAITNGIAHNRTITALNLSFNAIRDQGAIAIANILASNQSALRWVSVYHNDITDDGGRALSQALHTNRTLVYLNVGMNRLTDLSGNAIGAGLRHHRSMEVLDISDNHLTLESSAAIGKGAKHLDALIARNNRLGDGGIDSLCQRLRRSKLSYLDIRGNAVTRRGYDAVHALENGMIKTLLTSIAVVDDFCDDDVPREIPIDDIQSVWSQRRSNMIRDQLRSPADRWASSSRNRPHRTT